MPPFKQAANQKLSKDEMKDIIIFGMPKAWCKEMDCLNFDLFVQSIPQLTDFCEWLEGAEEGANDRKFQKQVSKKAESGKKTRHSKSAPGEKWCEFHESDTHNTSKCKTLLKMKNKDSKDNKSRSKSCKKQSDDAKTYTKKELHAMVKKEKAKSRKGFKANPKKADDDSDESVNMLDRDEAKAQQLADEAIDKALVLYDAKDYDESGKQDLVSFDI